MLIKLFKEQITDKLQVVHKIGHCRGSVFEFVTVPRDDALEQTIRIREGSHEL